MHLTKDEVKQYIDNFLNRTGGTWDWDDFISIPLDDPELERIRVRCATLPDRYPPTAPRQYCSDAGIAELQAIRKTLNES